MKKPIVTMFALLICSVGGHATDRFSSLGASIYLISSQAPPGAQATAAASRQNTMTGKVTRVSDRDKTLVIVADGKEVVFEAKLLRVLPAVGETIDITYTQTPGGPLQATTVKSSKSNSSESVANPPGGAPAMTGKVTRVNNRAKTFVLVVDGKEVTFSGPKLKALPVVGATVDLSENSARFVFATCDECNSVCPGVCFLGPDSCRCYLYHLRTR